MPKGVPGKVPATCHPEKFTHARGLCDNCYRRAIRVAVPRKPRPMASCHPDRPHQAFGLCYSCYQGAWKLGQRRRDPEKRKAYNLRHRAERLRLKPRDIEAMHLTQNGQCAACGETPAKTLHVDHCHTTGKIRGLLCHNCNAALGHARDSIPRLRALIAYLESSLAAEPPLSLFS